MRNISISSGPSRGPWRLHLELDISRFTVQAEKGQICNFESAWLCNPISERLHLRQAMCGRIDRLEKWPGLQSVTLCIGMGCG